MAVEKLQVRYNESHASHLLNRFLSVPCQLRVGCFSVTAVCNDAFSMGAIERNHELDFGTIMDFGTDGP